MKLSFDPVANFITGAVSTNRSAPRERPEIDLHALGEKKVLLAWEGMSRPHSNSESDLRMNRSFTTIGIVVALVLVILQEFFLLLLIGSIMFVRYVLTRVPPEKVGYTISTHGITIGEDLYYWQDLNKFFFTETSGHHILAVDTYDTVMPRLFINYHAKDRSMIKDILEKHILFLEEPPKSMFDKTYDSIVGKLNVK